MSEIGMHAFHCGTVYNTFTRSGHVFLFVFLILSSCAAARGHLAWSCPITGNLGFHPFVRSACLADQRVPQPTSQQDWETKCLFGLCPHSSKMPNKRDKIPFQWPQGKDESWFAKRLDTFPNGTQLTVYSPNVFQTQIQSSLDKVVSSQLKANKKWIFVIDCAQELIRYIHSLHHD